ncbi:tripartite tricarboxylate transporter substrate binding protein [Roseibacterium beibuensis]|uniref:Tripartite tricarboxylate transporter substrate binding protein n=1 Tax=[Roseibacterium] beibuensis TaxID=1193142 RepID=A0ABP9KUP8_9RHOB|nr:tripartite tricarboxylate transporter substrate binding protein [Roseibacterium beibuensis]MCS6622076.1 tripartite tricarboxylate transporter substrate binding protein [Roseibacterium beibuensis]
MTQWNPAVTRRAGMALLLSAAAAMTMPTQALAQAEAWPERPITFVVGFGVGGSADRTARALAQFMTEEIGQPITVVNRDGAGGQLAATYVLAQPNDGYTLLATAISPYLANSILNTGAEYTLDDFAFINGQWSDHDLIAASTSSGIGSMAEMIAAIRDNPGEHSVSVVTGSAGELSTYILLDAAGIPFENLNIVTYESGGAARAAAAGGQVDFTILGAEGSDAIRDMITPLAVVAEEPLEGWEGVPVVNDALAEAGLEMPVVSGSIRGLAASAAFRGEHPDRWETVVLAYERTMQNPEFLAFLEENEIGADWLGPERTTERVRTNYEILERFGHLMQQ